MIFCTISFCLVIHDTCETYKYKCHDFDSCKHIVSRLTFNRPISSINSCNLFVSCIAIDWNSRNRSVSPSIVPSYSWLHLTATNNYDTLTKRARPRLTKKIKRKRTREWESLLSLQWTATSDRFPRLRSDTREFLQ